jgi:REP element-mobilizing transposase RayT
LKGYTARKANEILGRSGTFWEAESYDHQVRDQGEYLRIIKYVIENPVKACLVRNWRDWEWTWVADDLRDHFEQELT